jgi:hypothetical protein
MKTPACAALLLLCLTGCAGGAARPAADAATSQPDSTLASATAEASPAAEAPAMRGNAATNPACKLLSLNQVSTQAALPVIAVLGLPADTTNPAKHSESCTWFLEPKVVQSSLVVQYTMFAKPPADLKAYYPQVIAQGFGRAVPKLGDISKIQGHVLDTVYKRAEIHVSLLTHAEATAQDKLATIALMRLVMAGIKQ